NSPYHLANQLGARFTPSNQGHDPIRGRFSQDIDFEGVCYGHVMSWRDEIESTGRYLGLPRHNKKTFQYQNQQKQNTLGIKLCKSPIDIWETVDNVIASLNSDSIYKLGFRTMDSAHVMGLRKLNTGEIEFFDSNSGLFVFKNSTSFRIWLIQLFSVSM